MAAMAATRQPRAASLPKAYTGCGTQPRLFGRHEQREGQREAGQQRRPPRAAFALHRAGQLAPRQRRGQHDHRQQHRHAQQLDQRGDVAGFGAHGLAGTDHLRHAVDAAAEKDACGPRVQAGGIGQHWGTAA